MKKLIAVLILALCPVLGVSSPASADKPRLGIHGTQGLCKQLPNINSPAGDHGSYILRQLVDRCLRLP